MALTSGTRIGGYEIVGALGAGGMGEVYRARDTRLDRVVAIKALPQAFAHDPARLARFEREAKLLASLAHPNIAGIHGIADSEGVPYLVLEFVAGETLAARLSRGSLSVEEALAVGSQIASAIEAAHERGVVHRDLKPSNVMLTPAGAVKVLDFGIAKDRSATVASASVAGTEPITAEGAVLGTAAYMSPEQARGLAVDRRTDIWAFGCILFECLAGRKPFAGATSSDMIAKVLERDPEWSAFPSGAPPRLRDLVRRCLQKNADDRPGEIGALRRELDEMAQDSKAPRSRSAGPSIPSLAVLYFENISSDPESDYFCAGITEDILTDLSKIKGLRVASRNAIAKFRGAAVEIPKVAAELGVTAVVEGSVRRAGDRVRITAQLINAADGFHLWAERYDRTLQDVFAVQEEIASSIVSALRVALTPSESQELLRDRPEDVRAYDLYLKGREQYGRYSQDSLREALSLFERATRIEPNYSLAWAGIADCYGQMVQWGTSARPEELGRLGLEAARRAVSLDPKLAEGHKAEALVLKMMHEYDRSNEALKRALSANPRFTPAWINLGVRAFEVADVAQAERCNRRAMEIDPQDTFAMGWLAQVLYHTHRDDESLALMSRMRGQTKEPFYTTGAFMQTGLIHVRRGDLASARRVVAAGRVGGARGATMQVLEAKIAAQAGDLTEAGRLLTMAESSLELGPLAIMSGAEVAVQRGEKDRAVALVRRTVWEAQRDTVVRLVPMLHPLLDQEPLAPRRSARTLIWPAEAPPVAPEIAELFADVRVESGRPATSVA